MKGKKWLALGLVLVMVLAVLAGCGQQETAGDTGEEEKPVLEVGTNAAFPPFEFRDEQNNIVGFDIDLMNAIGEKLGMEVQYKDVPFEGIIAGLLAEKYDVIAAGLTITEERKEKVNFSDPYFNAGQVIVVLIDNEEIKSEADLVGHSVGVQVGTTADLYLTEEMEGVDIRRFDNYPLAFLELRNGGIDAVVCDLPVAVEYVKENSDAVKLASDEPFTEEYFGIAIRKEDTELLEKINTALAELKESGELDAIYAKWFK